MMIKDLETARKKWIKEAKKPKEKAEREQSDFLKYQNSAGEFADFHSNRHTFITNLERAGVSPRTAQSLARHSDIRLTMGIYTHIGFNDQISAIDLLPPPPGARRSEDNSTSTKKINGSKPGSTCPITDMSQLDAIWANLPGRIKKNILSLLNAADKR
jgi:hypothetical protein